jgi:GNAT superfamily N-acetyltransferase
MSQYHISKPTPKQVRWAVGREFVHLPPVDPAFAPENMGVLRRLLLRYLALPANYRKLVGYYLEIEGNPAGYIFARPSLHAVRIDSLAVEAEYRRQGYATLLLNEITGVAEGRELDFLSTTLNPENKAGLAFFQKHGFRAYQPEQWVLGDVEKLGTAEEGFSIRELPPKELIDAYDRWTQVELKQGDAWAEEVVLAEYPRLSLVAQARHWACLKDGEEAGYLRLAGLRGTFRGYLAADQSAWAGAGQTSWLALAIQQYPIPPSEVILALGSWGHHKTAQPALEQAGFEVQAKPRFLMFKALEESEGS